MDLQVGQHIRVMWLRDTIVSDSMRASSAPTDTTASSVLIPSGTIYDGTIAVVAPDGRIELILAPGQIFSLQRDDPAIAIAVLTEFAPRRE
jgi:hypothetical protein